MREALTVLLRRVEERPGRTLAFPAPETARWIQTLVDASHLGADTDDRARTAAQLRRIVDRLVGRSSTVDT